MSNTSTPGTVPGEYTRGTGFTFPNQPTFAQDTAVSTSSSSTQAAATYAATFPAGAVKGQLAYNTSLGHLFIYSGAAWVQIT